MPRQEIYDVRADEFMIADVPDPSIDMKALATDLAAVLKSYGLTPIADGHWNPNGVEIVEVEQVKLYRRAQPNPSSRHLADVLIRVSALACELSVPRLEMDQTVQRESPRSSNQSAQSV